MQASSIRFNTLYREGIFFLTVVTVWLFVLLSFFSTPMTLLLESWPIIIIAFFSAAIANATAVGGGFIFLPLFAFFYDLSAIQSLKLALSTQAFGMTSGALSWPRKLIIWPYFSFACIASSFGMVLGTFFWMPSNGLIHEIFAYASIAIGIVLLVEANQKENNRTESLALETRRQFIGFFLVCLLGGLITAWISIGIGEVVAMWLLFQARHNIASSVATGVAVLAYCSVLGFIFHNFIGGIAWHYLIFTSVGVILGGRVGAKLGTRISTPKLRNNLAASKKTNQAPGKSLKLLVAFVILLDGIVVLWLHQPTPV